MITSFDQLVTLPVTLEHVHIESLHDSVCLRVFSGTAQDQLEEMLLEGRLIESYDGQPQEDRRFWIKRYTIRLVALSLCDEAGHLLCTTPEQLDALGNLEHKVLNEIAVQVRRVNGLDQQVATVLEDAEKNSNGVLSVVSGSA
jgi:hypothetical protein